MFYRLKNTILKTTKLNNGRTLQDLDPAKGVPHTVAAVKALDCVKIETTVCLTTYLITFPIVLITKEQQKPEYSNHNKIHNFVCFCQCSIRQVAQPIIRELG